MSVITEIHKVARNIGLSIRQLRQDTIANDRVGVPNGIASLDGTGKVPADQINQVGGSSGLDEAQVKGVISQSIVIKNTTDSPPVNPSIVANLSIAIGHGSQAGFDQLDILDKENISFGYNAWSRVQGVAVGAYAKNNGGYDVAVGQQSQTYGDGAAVGHLSQARYQGVAVGKSAVGQNYSAAIGMGAISANYSVSLGWTANNTATYCTSIGAQSKCEGEGAVAVGHAARAAEMYAISIGKDSYHYGIGIGRGVKGASVNQINIGVESGSNDYFAYNSIAIGSASKARDEGVVIGATAVAQAASTVNLGYGARCGQINGIVIGKNSTLYSSGSQTNSIAIGVNATSNYDNTILLGGGTAVTGANQVQLGNSDTTTYTYGAVQNRSDSRDKAEIQDCPLGLDFINALEPKRWKWDYREDYLNEKFPLPEMPARPAYPTLEVDPEINAVDQAELTSAAHLAYQAEIELYDQAVIEWQSAVDAVNVARHAWLVNPTDKGTKIRNRAHYGLIAQDVEALLTAEGIDFGGYQHHTVTGGNDVHSLGYSEFIAPMIKAIQELSARVVELESK